MNDLELYREELANCDAKITEALKERYAIIEKIMAYKEEYGMPILQPEQEEKQKKRLMFSLHNDKHRDEIYDVFERWQRITSWLCSHWRSWSGNCAHVGCIHISSPVTRDGRTILPLRLPTKTRAVHHSKNEYTTHRRPMMPTTNRTTPKKMQRAVF